ncbi:MAG: hypothetical protein LBG62_03540 [Candidatus Methanoplasma sp.]|jgi:hypothetical protein|nr:hypothetical protein [Candidatus Methanoplasma sp.]
MAKDRDNYCYLIGLNPMKESTYNADSIEKKIAAKEVKWKKFAADKQNPAEKRFQAQQCFDAAPDMRKVMADPALRGEEFADARTLLRAKAARLLKDCITLHDGTKVLISGAAENLAKKMQWDGVDKSDLISLSGIKKTVSSPPVNERVLAAYKGLAEVRAFTVAEMLNSLIDRPALSLGIERLDERSGPAQIRAAFEACEKRVKTVKQGVLPDQDSYILAMRAVKAALASDKDLSDLLTYGRCMKALEPAKEAMDTDYGQPFSREYLDRLLLKAVGGSGRDYHMARAILEDYCVKKKYIANFSERDSRLAECPGCGALVDAGDDVMCCSVCGCEIKTKCPQCGRTQASSNGSCVGCGFDFKGGLAKARDLEKRFRSAVSQGRIEEAAEHLAGVKRAYSTYPSLKSMEGELRPLQARYSEVLKSANSLYRQKKYFALEARIDAALGDFPKITSNPEIGRMYDEAASKVGEADRICEKAASHGDPLPLYVSAAEICPDHPAAMSKIRENPPESPSDATAQPREGKVLVKFAVPEERAGMTFCVFRGRDGLPAVSDDTEPLAEIPGGVYLDKSPDPGVDLYYSVYSKRWGVLSRDAAQFGPVSVCPEVEDVAIEPVEGGLRLIYEKPRGCSRVRIWRKEGTSAAGKGDEVEISHGGQTVIDDLGLKGGVRYHYLFVAEYRKGGRTERSMGTEFSHVPPRVPDPPKSVEIKWNKSDGSFTARWKSPERVVLYSSPRRVELRGRVVKMEDLGAWMSEIPPIESYDDGVRFSVPDGAVQYVYPMIPAGKVAVRGKEIMVANLKPFRDVEKRVSGGDCDITMTWPTGAESAVIAVKDAPASGPDDLGAEMITITREAYNMDRRVRVPMGGSKKRVATIYAAYDVSGEKMFSRGMCLDLYSGSSTKVRYSMSAEGDGRGAKFTICIDTDRSVAELPPLSAVRVQEGIPLRRRDGEAIWSSNRPVALSGGKATIAFSCKPGTDPSRVRVFFDGEDSYNLFKFIHPVFKEK